MSEPFNGFPKATRKFLKELKKNNNRDWFNQNKSRYESDILEPSLAFIEAMQTPLKKISPYFQAIPKRTGGSLMRIYKDTRFAKDKTPYKTNIVIQFRHEMGRDVHAPGFYFHIESDEAFIGAGIWRPESAALKKIRQQIVDDDDRWRRIVKSKALNDAFEFAGESLKRPPRDFDPNHPLIHDMKRKDHFVLAKIPHSDLLRHQLPHETSRLLKKTVKYVEFLCDALKLPF